MRDPLATWKEENLPSNQSESGLSTGRPLYTYRLDATQYQTLREALHQRISGVSRIDYLVENHHHFTGLFLLFAAEWWRREYTGGRWRWRPIEEAVGLSDMAWSPTLRGRAIEKGLRYWGLPFNQGDGLRYLGAVALQGGLPLNLLAEGKGRLGLVLQRVLRLARKGAPRRSDLLGWVESLSDHLPQSYRDVTIYHLLTDLIQTISQLVESVEPSASQDAIAVLDARKPDWRQRLPLPLDDQTAQGLIDQLIRDATTADKRASTSGIPMLSRHLASTDDEFFVINSSLDLSERIDSSELCSLFKAEEQDLGRRLTLALHTPTGECTWSLTRLAGSTEYRVPTQAHLLSGEAACNEHRLHLASAMGGGWSAWPRQGDALDPDLPWLFEEDKGWRSVGQGGGSVQSLRAMVAIPEGSQVQPVDTDSSVSLQGYLEEPERELYLCQGRCRIISNDDRWQLRTGRADAEAADYHWQAQPLWLDLIRPSRAYIGPMTLLEGERRINAHELQWSPGGTPGELGPVTITHREHGEIRYRTRLLHLPEGAGCALSPIDTHSGRVVITGWGARLARLTNGTQNDVQMNSSFDGQALTLSLRADRARTPPERVEVELLWPGNPYPSRLRLPFPARGVHFYDGHDRPVRSGSWLSLRRLAGTRLTTLGRLPALVLRFTLRRPGNRLDDRVELRYPLKAEQDDSRNELRLIDYQDEIERILGVDSQLDAWVEMALESRGEQLFQLRLSRYLCRLLKQEGVVALTEDGLGRATLEELSELRVLALRLESPQEDPVELDPITSEGTATGSWHFATEVREPGAWLIYPGEGAGVLFRPTLYPIDGEVTPGSDLTRAITIADREERVSALDAVIAQMADNFNHPGWSEVELYQQHLAHLPLAALDLWRRMAVNPRAMAALVLRMGSIKDEILMRFPVELPFAWGLLPARDWFQAMQGLQRQCESWSEIAERASGLLRRHLAERVTWLAEQAPAMTTLLQLCASRITRENSPELAFLLTPAADTIFAAQLFSGDACELQHVVRRHTDDQWPNTNDLYEHIAACRKETGDELFAPARQFQREVVINLPILLAIQVLRGKTRHWFAEPEQMFALRSVQAFDRDWFDSAFDLTIRRAISRGWAITEHEEEKENA